MKTIREMFLNETEQRLLEALKNTNRAQRLSRQGAAAICGGDRRARDIIHGLRLKKYPICSDSRQGGYFLAQMPQDLTPMLKESDSRLKELKEVHDALLIAQFGMVTRGEGL